MNNWKTHTLGELVKSGGGKIHTGPFGSQLHASDYVQSGIPCIMPANMKDNRVDLSGISFISEQDATRLSKYLVKSGDVVYSRRGDVTQKALIRDDEAGYFCGTGCLLLRTGSEIDPEFLTYYLSTDSIKKWIVKQAVGATMPNLNTGILASIPFTGPTKREQQKLSAAISSINQKIELNNKINTELEAMAKLIYDYWFVQFDFPDANGKPYKSSGGKMVYNEALKREIPEGWEVFKLSEILKSNYSSIGKNNSFDEIEYLDTGSLTKNVIGGTERINIERDKLPSRAKRIINKNDILYSTVRPNLCHYGIIKNPIDNMIGSTGFVQLSSKKRGVSNDLIYTFLTLSWITARLQQIAALAVSAYPSISPNDILELNIVLPKERVDIEPVNSKLDVIYSKISLNQEENKKLSELRDWLLPMLMNGQVTVKD